MKDQYFRINEGRNAVGQTTSVDSMLYFMHPFLRRSVRYCKAKASKCFHISWIIIFLACISSSPLEYTDNSQITSTKWSCFPFHTCIIFTHHWVHAEYKHSYVWGKKATICGGALGSKGVGFVPLTSRTRYGPSAVQGLLPSSLGQRLWSWCMAAPGGITRRWPFGLTTVTLSEHARVKGQALATEGATLLPPCWEFCKDSVAVREKLSTTSFDTQRKWN